MPAEAIHLSALDDTLARDPALARAVGADAYRRLLRLGAVWIDLAYFDHFALGVARYLLGRPITTSAVGDRLHQTEPMRLGKLLLHEAARLRARPSTRAEGDRVLALASGYFSHAAVDARLHPLVNRYASERARRLSDRPARQHNEVEKFHSILFHEERLGFDFMGDARLLEYIGIDTALIADGGPIDRALAAAIAGVHGEAPSGRERRRWARGYDQYTRLLASPFGRLIMPARVKAEVRGEVYAPPGARFVDHYADAVERSLAHMRAAVAYAETLDDAAFDREVPEGSIDDPPYATDADRGLVQISRS